VLESAPTQDALPDIPVRPADLAALPGPVAAPVTLTIDDLGVAIPVEPVGVADDGQMEIPPLAEVAGWYRHGPSPAQNSGSTVIAAHVDSIASAGLGPFARLGELRPGSAVSVTLEDGTVRGYTVTSVERAPKTAVVWDDVFVRDGDHRLVLVTCGGTFQRQARSYSDNVIVTAEPD
jgi:LPXTG-site transpeptidase (sortase) family protein